MLELLFVIGFFIMLMVTGVSLLGIPGRARCGHGGDVCRRFICPDD